MPWMILRAFFALLSSTAEIITRAIIFDVSILSCLLHDAVIVLPPIPIISNQKSGSILIEKTNAGQGDSVRGFLNCLEHFIQDMQPLDEALLCALAIISMAKPGDLHIHCTGLPIPLSVPTLRVMSLKSSMPQCRSGYTSISLRQSSVAAPRGLGEMRTPASINANVGP